MLHGNVINYNYCILSDYGLLGKIRIYCGYTMIVSFIDEKKKEYPVENTDLLLNIDDLYYFMNSFKFVYTNYRGFRNNCISLDTLIIGSNSIVCTNINVVRSIR